MRRARQGSLFAKRRAKSFPWAGESVSVIDFTARHTDFIIIATIVMSAGGSSAKPLLHTLRGRIEEVLHREYFQLPPATG